jgi:hypothetical protein
MTKRITACALLALLFAAVTSAERQNLQFTLTAGTGVRISAGKLVVNRLVVQSRAGNTGIALLSLGVPVGTACDATSAAQLTAEIAPGDATHPGGSFIDPPGANGNTISDAEDLSKACLDTTHTGDKVIVTYFRRY